MSWLLPYPFFLQPVYTGDITAELTCRGKVNMAKNLETGKALSVSGNRITFPLKKHDFMLIEAELE